MKLRQRVQALEAARHDDYVPVDMGPASIFGELYARLEALRDGRPSSIWHNPLRPAGEAYAAQAIATKRRLQAGEVSPGDRLVERLDEMRRRMADDPEDADVTAQLRKAEQDTIRQIEAENRQRERRERHRAKKARRKERKQAAPVAAS